LFDLEFRIYDLYVFRYNVLSVNTFCYNFIFVSKTFVFKSAAVYACAQEQGFHVVEVYNYLKYIFEYLCFSLIISL